MIPAIPTASSALSSYLPKVLLERLAASPLLTEPEVQHTTGAVLISDVEGFTALVERFGRRGRAGLEELTWTLNRYVADLAEIVHSAGGDVLSIAGDALLCYWPAVVDTPEALTDATLAATRAGFAIQQRLREREAETEHRFETRIGVGAGDVVLGFVGGFEGRWEVIAGGAAFHDAGAAERAARSGDVVLARRAWDYAQGQCTGTTIDGNFTVVTDAGDVVLPPLPRNDVVLPVSVLRPFLPFSVRDRLATAPRGNLEWLAETRRVSVLMTELPAIDSDEAAELSRVHAAIRAFQDVVERCEGASKVDVDEKGVLLLGAFGVPPRAHENDAERAAHAATLVAEELALLRLFPGVGVATGRAFCGAFGSDVRRDYMIRGDVINLAARLMRTGHGGVCCDADTMEAAHGRMEFETLSQVTVKGRSGAIDLYRPLGRRELAHVHEEDMVGRAVERAALAAALAGVREGVDRVFILEGDAGLGKSRLLGDAVQNAAGADLRVFHVSADAIERSTPYYAWRQVFTAMLGIPMGADAAFARDHVVRYMEAFPALQRFTPLLSAVLPVRFEDNELTIEMTADVRAENSKQLLAALLRHAAAESPTFLAVEDAHWLDSGSWALLLEVIRVVHPLLVVCTTRPVGEPAPDDFARLARVAADGRLRLGNLSLDEMTNLIAHTLRVPVVPRSLAEFVYERVSGHPFFCEELVRAMLDVGAIRVEEGRCVFGDLRVFDLPTTVEGVIVSRLDRLTSAQQVCLKVASVIGRIFRARLVEDTHPIAAEHELVRGNLRELSALDLTAVESFEPELAYLFKHVITRDVTYEMMPIAHRQPLHRAVALWHERQYANDLAPQYGLLAHHWSRAGDPVKAVEFLEKAGQHAVRTGAFREGILLLSKAVDLMTSGAVPSDSFRRALWEKSMGIASYFLGDMPGSRAHLARALAELHRPVPDSRGAAIRGSLAAVGRQVMHRLAPRRFLGRRSADKATLDEAVECYKALTQACYMEGAGPEWLLVLIARGLNLGEEAGDSAPLARVMINASMMACLMGLPAESDRYARRAIAMAENNSAYAAAAFVWHIRALTLAQQALWQPLKEANTRALELVQALGDVGLESEVWLVRSTVAHCAGDFINAPSAWTRMREVADRNGNAALRCWSLLDEIETRLAYGETEGAVRALDEALAIPTPDSDLGMRLEKLRGIAMTRLRQGGEHIGEAMAAADSIFDLLQRTPPTGYHMADHFAAAIDVYVAVIRGYAGAEGVDADRVSRRAARGCTQLLKFGRTFVHVQPRALLLRGVLRAHRGDLRKARRDFLASEARAAELCMPVDQGRALAERAALRDGRDPPAELLIAEANALFERAGATYYTRPAS